MIDRLADVARRARRRPLPGESRLFRLLIPTPLNPLRRAGITVLSTEETITRLLTTEASLARFGDGEFNLMMGGEVGFQTKDARLGRRLREVLHSESPDLLVGIPASWVSDPGIVDSEIRFWGRYLVKHGREIRSLLPRRGQFADSSVTRLYIPFRDARTALRRLAALRQLWEDRDLLIVEGEHSRIGVGNDLLDNARSVSRLLCPATNAFSVLEEITSRAADHSSDRLVLTSLGPAATILAHDLAHQGIRCLDLGHVDLEYEWALADQGRIPVRGRSVNEIAAPPDLELDADARRQYESQILETVGLDGR